MKKTNVFIIAVIIVCFLLSIVLWGCNYDGWCSDEEYHWHDCPNPKTNPKSEYGVHIWDDGVIATSATYESTGMKTCMCSTCGKIKSFVIPKLDKDDLTEEVASYFSSVKNYFYEIATNIVAYCSLEYKNSFLIYTYLEYYDSKEKDSEMEVSDKLSLSFPVGDIKNFNDGIIEHLEKFTYNEQIVAGNSGKYAISSITYPLKTLSGTLKNYVSIGYDNSTPIQIENKCKNVYSSALLRLEDILQSSGLPVWQKILVY